MRGPVNYEQIFELSEGSLDRILDGENDAQPVVQVLGIRRILGIHINRDKYRLLLSDGERSNSFVILASQLNELVTSKVLSQYAIVRITRYGRGILGIGDIHKAVIVVLSMEILATGEEVGSILGPMSLDCDNNEDVSVER